MRILICDDHAVFADSLALVITRSGRTVVGVTYSPQQALRALRDTVADVCLLDVNFPEGSSLGRMAELREAAPVTRFVLLSGLLDGATFEAGIEAGVAGFADKSQQAGDILRLLDRVHAGERVIGRARQRSPAPVAPRSDAQRYARFLTAREREVLTRLARGESTAALARAMGVTRNTARSHVQSVLTKLGVHSQREAVVQAARHGLVDVETGEWLPR